MHAVELEKDRLIRGLTLLALTALLWGCSPSEPAPIEEKKTALKEVDFGKLQQRRGLVFEVNDPEPFTGISTTYYDNTQLLNRSEYLEGLLHGDHVTFYENGELKSRGAYERV